MSLPSSMADFVPCDRLLQKAYYLNGKRFMYEHVTHHKMITIEKKIPSKASMFQEDR